MGMWGAAGEMDPGDSPCCGAGTGGVQVGKLAEADPDGLYPDLSPSSKQGHRGGIAWFLLAPRELLCRGREVGCVSLVNLRPLAPAPAPAPSHPELPAAA